MCDVLFIRSSAFKTSRLMRQANELHEIGLDVNVIHWERLMDKAHNDKVIGDLPYKKGVYSFEKKCEYGQGFKTLFKRILWFYYIFSMIVKLKPKVVHAVDFDSSFAALLACKVKKIDLIYDIADYIETFDSKIPWFIRKTVKFCSGVIVKYSSVVILPDKNRLNNIHPSQTHKVRIINNAPAINLNELPNNDFLVDINKLNVIYYGAFNEDRGIREIIEAARALQSDDIVFWFAGWGALEGVIDDCELKNVNFIGKLTQFQALSLLKEMSLSIIAYDPKFEHNKVASPNKIFEAMAIGTPVLVSKGTSIDLLVDDEDLGLVCDYTSDSIIENIRRLDPELLSIYSKNISNLYSEYRWEHSKNVLLRIYDKYK